MDDRYETCTDGTGTWNIGISLGTVYSLDYNEIIKLWNFGYCIKTGKFYFNENVHLNSRIIKSLNGKKLNDDLKLQLSELDIYERDLCQQELNEYQETLNKTEEARQKVFAKMGKKFE